MAFANQGFELSLMGCCGTLCWYQPALPVLHPATAHSRAGILLWLQVQQKSPLMGPGGATRKVCSFKHLLLGASNQSRVKRQKFVVSVHKQERENRSSSWALQQPMQALHDCPALLHQFQNQSQHFLPLALCSR